MSRRHTKAARRRSFREHCARVRLDAWLRGESVADVVHRKQVASAPPFDPVEDDRSRRRYAQRVAWLVDGVIPDNPWGDWRVLPEDVGVVLRNGGAL